MEPKSESSTRWHIRACAGLTVLLLVLVLAVVQRFAGPAEAEGQPTTPPPTQQDSHEAKVPHESVADDGHADAVRHLTPTDHAADDHAEDHGNAGTDTGHGDSHGHHAVPEVAWYWMLPFALLLGSIAVVPLINMHFWEHRYPWFAIGLGTITAVYYLFFYHSLPDSRAAWLHEMKEYVSFIALLGSLYVVSGGIVINVSRKATPITNTVLLLVGGVIANIFGTTGAAMLLIRPYIRINRDHIKPYHIVFFIFIVANCGGSLTPIGDPPLFMGYLKGVPFFWVLEALWPMWATVLALLLVIFFGVDKFNASRTKRNATTEEGPSVSILGFQNFLFIALILVAVFQESMFEFWADGEYVRLFISREVLMIVAGIASKLTSKPLLYERNEFTYGPIREVAILFVGIFSTMVPALNYLNHHSDKMPLNTPGQYYFITGTLSSMLDNAPTYLVFLETRQGQVQNKYADALTTLRGEIENAGQGQTQHGDNKQFMDQAHKSIKKNYSDKIDAGTLTDGDIRIGTIIGVPQEALYLIAISVGAVFFGACTYIGNGPNFMVKSIAESSGIQMPSFFGYVIRYALPVLVPVYILVWWLYFR